MTDISTLGQALSQISRLQSQQLTLNELTTQLTTGKKAQDFSGLGSEAILTKRARASINSIDTYTQNITNANRRIEQMDLALDQFQKQADILVNSFTVNPEQGDYPDFDIIQDLANNIFDFLVDLVNTKDGDRYLFAGSDSDTKPLDDNGLLSSFLGEFVPDSSNLTNPPLTASGSIGLWGSGAITTDQFITSYKSVDDTTIGYSAPIASNEAGKLITRVDDAKQIDYTLLGNTEGFRDIILAVGVLRELPPPEFAPGALNDPTATTLAGDTAPFPPSEKQENFFEVLNDVGRLIAQGVDKIEDERFRLAQVQVQIETLNETYRLEKKAFQDTVGEIEDIDITEIAARISAFQVQLEASYTVTASISQLSLVNFFR